MFVWHLLFMIDKCLFRHGLQGFYSLEFTGLFLQINNAYSVLSDATQRLEYDLKLREVTITQSSEGSPFGSVPQHRWEAVILLLFFISGFRQTLIFSMSFWQVALKFSFPWTFAFFQFSWHINCLGPSRKLRMKSYNCTCLAENSTCLRWLNSTFTYSSPEFWGVIDPIWQLEFMQFPIMVLHVDKLSTIQ